MIGTEFALETLSLGNLVHFSGTSALEGPPMAKPSWSVNSLAYATEKRSCSSVGRSVVCQALTANLHSTL